MADKILQETSQLVEQLKKDFPKFQNLQQSGQLLEKLKVLLTKLSFITISQSQKPADQKLQLLSREVLEIGAYHSIKAKDIPAFERYIAQLSTFYYDLATVLPASQKMYPLLGLNLLRLLAQNRIADFHVQLERIDSDQILNNVFIKFPVTLEQSLMEGSYNKVYRSRSDVPSEECTFFVDILSETIRGEIASCCEKAYSYLPVQDAVTMFYLKDSTDLMKFCQTRGWVVNAAEKKIYFSNQGKQALTIDQKLAAKQVLQYSLELEKIV